MIRRSTRLIMAFALLFALWTPAAALADGPVDPLATHYLASVTHAPPGVRAKVIDGYLQMWMSVRPSERVVVEDQLGAGWLRFDRQGVFENHHSLLYYISQTPVEAIPPRQINAHTPPDWVKVSSGHSYRWRDGRIQAFAFQSLTPGSDTAGHWSIRMTVAGRPATVSGPLRYRPSPSIVWFWPVLVIVLCVAALWRLGSARLDRRATIVLSLTLILSMAVLAVARLLHGRPAVTWFQGFELVVVIAGLGAGAWALARGRLPAALPFLVALLALWAGLTFLPLLTHPYVLLVLPGWLARAATVLLLGGGVGLVALALRRPLSRAPG